MNIEKINQCTLIDHGLVMGLPINKIEGLNYVDNVASEEFTSFSKQIQQKYNLSIDMMRIINLFSFEELIALRLEQMAKVFNGKLLFPVRELLILSISRALEILIETYPTKQEQRKIQNLFLMNKNTKKGIIKKYEYFWNPLNYIK